MIKRHYLYLKEKQKIKSRILDFTTFMFERDRISKMSRCCYIFWRNQLLTKVDFLNADNRIHNCQNNDFETIKKKKSIFSKT
jgi:hypothetical protein